MHFYDTTGKYSSVSFYDGVTCYLSGLNRDRFMGQTD
jgi:hypothetical protein